MTTFEEDAAARTRALLGEGRLDEAERECRASLERSESAYLFNLLGNVLVRRERPLEAEAAFSRAVSLDPSMARAHNNLGNLLFSRGLLDAAISEYERALALPGATATTVLNLGRALLARHRFTAARGAFERALAMAQDDARARLGLARALRGEGSISQAIDVLKEGLDRAPGDATLTAELGSMLLDAGRHELALPHLERAFVALRGEPAVALNLAQALERDALLIRAKAIYEEVCAIPRHAVAATTGLAAVLFELGEHEAAVELLSSPPADATDEERIRLASARLFHLDHLLERGEELQRAHAAWGLKVQTIHGDDVRRARHSRRRRPRIGFLSADLRNHVVARFLFGLLRALASHVELVLFSTTPTPDHLTDAFAAIGLLHTLGGVDRDGVRRTIEAQELDVLVELGGHTGDDLARVHPRLAPTQLIYLGYPGTSGLPSIDYRLTDRWVDPPGQDGVYTEAALRLDRTAWCYEPPGFFPPASPARPRSAPVFGCFGRLSKYSSHQLDLFASVLRESPRSLLVMRARPFREPETQEAVLAKLRARGVSADRVKLVSWVDDLREAQTAYADVDVVLDTFPYHGTTTTCDALLAGRPVISLRGDQPASRVASSLLAAVDCDDLVATDDAGFVERAVALSADRQRLEHLAAALPRAMREGTLGDARGLAQAILQALVEAKAIAL